jgi:uncharacterized protein YbdZ (MbtH family)
MAEAAAPPTPFGVDFPSCSKGFRRPRERAIVPVHGRRGPVSSCSMNAADATPYAIVVSQEQQYNIWPLHHPLPAGFRLSGQVGTRAEMETLLAQQFVETTPAGYYSNTEFPGSNWAP